MKNFTNNFKQFTSRLSARWLIMALMMLVGTSSAWAANLYIYSTSSSAKAWIWVEGGSNYTGEDWNSRPALSNTTYFESLGNNIYRYKKETLPSKVSIILTPSGGSPEARIDNLSLSSDKYLSYSGGSSITQVTRPTNRYVAGSTAGDTGGTDNVFGTRWEADGSTNKMTWDASKCLFVKEYITNEASSMTLTFKITDGTWSNSWPSSNKTQSVSSGCRITTITFNIFTNAVSSTSASSSACCVTVNTPDVSADKSAVCKGGTVTLNLNSRQDGVTYKIGNTEIFSGSTTTYEFTPTGNVSVEASHANSCDGATATKNITIRVDEPSELTFTYAETTICKGEEVTLDDFVYSHTGTVTWYNSYSYVDSNKATDVVSPTSTHKYYATAKNGECSIAEAQLNVIVNKPPVTPTLSAENDVTEIISGSTTATLVVGNTENGATYTLYKGGVSTGNTGTRFEGISQEGTYTVVGNNNNGCGDSDFSDPIDITLCEPITGLTWSITEGEKDVYCPGDEVEVTLTYNGSEAKAHAWGGNWSGNIDILPDDYATGTVYTMTINKSGTVNLTLTGCNGATPKTSTLTFEVVEAPVKPTISFSANPVGQNKPTTLTVEGYNSTLNNYTLYKDGDSQGACASSQEITIGEVGQYKYHVVATSKACPSLTATSETVTLKVQEAGAKIVQLGDLTIYTNIKTDFVPMYVQKDGIVDVDGASLVKAYTWQYSQDGNSWDNCATNYASGVVGMSNGGADCNNWRADKAGRYRCLITYDNDGTQYSNVLSVSAATKTAPAVNTFGDLPIISVNTGSNSFPSDAGLSYKTTKCETKRYPSVHADMLKAKISVDVKIYDKTGKLQYDRKARMNYRGSSSLNFQKKSYAFVTGKEKTKNNDGDVNTGKANLFGLSNGCEDKDWVLYAATPDPSMMRNRLVFDLYKQMRPGEWGVNSMYVELIVNNEYKGVYVLMDKITNNVDRVNITSSGGFIVKFDKTDVEDRVENTEGDQKTFATSRTGTKNSSNGIESYGACIDQRFEIEYPEKEDVEDAGGNWEATYSAIQKRFEDFETALEEKDYSTVRSIIDYDSWADWFILSEFIKNQDGFRASNIFIYDGGKIKATPLWDQELSMDNRTRIAHGSNSAEGLLTTTSSVYTDNFPATFWFTGNNGSSITGGLLKDPCFVSLVKSKWATYHEGILSPSNISGMVADYEEELGNAKTREATKWPYTQAVRGTTTDGDYVGYYSDGEGDPSHYSFAASKNAINSWATNRSTPLGENTNGLGEALYNLEGEALIFTVSPSTVETTPWQQVILTVNAPEGYEYTVSYPDLTAAGAIVKEGNNTYEIKIPRPVDDWGTAGNGDKDDSEEYVFTANIEVSGENACGTMQDGTATSTITLKDVTEECNPEIKP